MTDEESLLDLALKAVIEALRMNPDRYAVIYNRKYDSDDNIFDSSTTPSAMPSSSPMPRNRYYNKSLLNQLVDKTMVVAVREK